MILVLCPILPEFKYVENHLAKRGMKFSQVSLPCGKKLLRSDQLFLGQGGHGKVEFALTTQQILMEYPKIEEVICLGAAGSLVEEVKLLDVVVGHQTIEHDYLNNFISRGSLPVYEASESMIRKFTGTIVEGYRVHHGAIASGDEDILSIKRAGEIHQQTKALAVAWEGAGGARACQRVQKKYLELRGVTDRCCGGVNQEFSKNLKIAMVNATDLLLQIF